MSDNQPQTPRRYKAYLRAKVGRRVNELKKDLEQQRIKLAETETKTIKLVKYLQDDDDVLLQGPWRACSPHDPDISDPNMCEALLAYFDSCLTVEQRERWYPGLFSHLDNPRYVAEKCGVACPPGYSKTEVEEELARRNAPVPCKACGSLVSPHTPEYRDMGLCGFGCGDEQ